MLTVELVSPEGILFEGEAEMVVARTVDGGEIAFLSGHVPFVGSLADGQVKVIQPGGREQLIAAHRGFVSVAEDRVSVLSDVAELAEEIDVARAEASKAAAEDALRANGDDEEARAALRRAEVRLQVAQSRRA
jgi:F-type H+-transporting ATPase subunit epsilon